MEEGKGRKAECDAETEGGKSLGAHKPFSLLPFWDVAWAWVESCPPSYWQNWQWAGPRAQRDKEGSGKEPQPPGEKHNFFGRGGRCTRESVGSSLAGYNATALLDIREVSTVRHG